MRRTGGDPLAGRDRGAACGLPVLDTYKQSAQPSIGAGFKRIRVSIRDDAGIPLWMCVRAIEGDLKPLEFLLLRRAHDAGR